MDRMVASFLCVFLVFPTLILAQTTVEKEIEEKVKANYVFAAENLMDNPGETSQHGSLAFWSSGGLLQEVSRADTPERYASFNLIPKHITVVPLGEGVAMAQFYVEGSYQPRNGSPVSHYLTRATQVFVLEDGEWRVRAAHFSPVTGGSGTHVTAVK